MTIDQLIDLNLKIEEELLKIPNFYTKYIEKCDLVKENKKVFDIFAFATYKTFTQHRMKEYTSYDFNCLALYHMQLQEASRIKAKLEKLVKFNEDLRPSLKKCNEIYNKSKQAVEEMKVKLKLSELQVITLMQENEDLF